MMASASTPSVFFDSNALIFTFESGSPWTQSLAKLMSEVEAAHCVGVISELSLAEILVKPLALGQQEHAELYRRLYEPDGPFQVEPVNRAVIERSASVQAVRGLKLADSLLLATAEISACSHFLTADERLGRKLGQSPAWLHPDMLGNWIS